MSAATRLDDLRITYAGGRDQPTVVEVTDRRTGTLLLRLAPEVATRLGQALVTAAVQTVDLAAQVRAGEAEQGGPR